MNLKTLLVASTFLAVTPAFAADLPTYQEPVAPAPVYMPFSWTGFYIGAHAGYAFGSNDVTTVGLGSASPDNNAFLLGAQGGYRYQFEGSNIVLGIEGDIDWMSGKKRDTYSLDAASTARIKSNWGGSVRATAGYAFDRFLPYLTGGVAFRDYDFDLVTGGALYKGSDTKTGWTVGGGLAYAFTDNIIGNVEYRYSDYGTTTYVHPNVGATKVDLKDHRVTVGVSYKF